MNAPTTSTTDPHDQWVEHPRGRLFTRTWAPADLSEAQRLANPIVLFHDSLGCVALWRDFPARLSRAARRRVIAYDRLGYGRSGPRTDRPSLRFVSEEAEVYFPVLRERLGVQGFVAFGHSVGGGMALHCAAEFASDCEALITESAQVFAEDRTLQGIRAAREQFRDAGQVERLARYHGDKARWVLDAWIESWLHPGFASWTLAEVLSRVARPVLALHGALDEYGSTRHAELVDERCGGPSRVAILADTGHVPHRERTASVLELVTGFLDE